MSDLRELYQQVILDHNRKPRNFRTLTSATGRAEGYNPLCGDRVTVEVALEDGVIRDIGFQGSGCAISKASASMMTAALKGKTVSAAEETFGRFRTMLTENGTWPANGIPTFLVSRTIPKYAARGIHEYTLRKSARRDPSLIAGLRAGR